MTTAPTTTELADQCRRHIARGGAVAAVDDLRTREGFRRWRVGFYTATGTGEMGERTWRFVRWAAVGIDSRSWAAVMSIRGVRGEGLAGEAVR